MQRTNFYCRSITYKYRVKLYGDIGNWAYVSERFRIKEKERRMVETKKDEEEEEEEEEWEEEEDRGLIRSSNDPGAVLPSLSC